MSASGQQPPPYGPGPGEVPASAWASLALGAASLLVLGLLAGVPAVVLGRRAVREIDASGGVLGGRRIAVAGVVTGAVGTVLSVLIILGSYWLLSTGLGLYGGAPGGG